MFVITMESESTSWVALGNTEREAKEAIADKWYGMCVCEMNPGQCETW